MMIQSAPAGEPRFCCSMVAHNGLCAQFMSAFGNDRFERPEPYDQVAYVVGHHDRGWEGADRITMLDPASRFPRGIGTSGLPSGTGGGNTSALSPDFNEKHHAYCGLLSSMHSWGLANARYGFTEFRVRPGGSTSTPVRPGEEETTQAMLDGEVARQERLKAVLAADPETAPWVEENRLMASYKLLQFFDTLALYFHLRHASEHVEEVFVHVPRSADEVASVTVRPLGDGRYSMDPFPFAGEMLQTSCPGRYFEALPEGDVPDDLGAAFFALPEVPQTYTLVAG